MKRKVLRIESNHNFSRQVLEDQLTNERFLRQTAEAALNEKIEEYRARSDVEHRVRRQIADLEAACEAFETSLCNENKKLRQENGELQALSQSAKLALKRQVMDISSHAELVENTLREDNEKLRKKLNELKVQVVLQVVLQVVRIVVEVKILLVTKVAF